MRTDGAAMLFKDVHSLPVNDDARSLGLVLKAGWRFVSDTKAECLADPVTDTVYTLPEAVHIQRCRDLVKSRRPHHDDKGRHVYTPWGDGAIGSDTEATRSHKAKRKSQ